MPPDGGQENTSLTPDAAFGKLDQVDSLLGDFCQLMTKAQGELQHLVDTNQVQGEFLQRFANIWNDTVNDEMRTAVQQLVSNANVSRDKYTDLQHTAAS